MVKPIPVRLLQLVTLLAVASVTGVPRAFCDDIDLLPPAGERRFTANELYGLINGGAELFLEFGFQDLVIHDYARGKDKVAVELYRMATPEGALGVYLMKVGEETPHPDLPVRNSYGRYQITALKGTRFIQVNNFSGEERLAETALSELRRALLDVEKSVGSPLLDLLPETNRIPGSERLVCGPYSLQNLYTLGKGDVLLLESRIYGAAARYRDEKGKTRTLIRIPYPDEQRAAAALDHLTANLDTLYTAVVRKENLLVFRDHKDLYGIVRRQGDLIELELKLASIKPGLLD